MIIKSNGPTPSSAVTVDVDVPLEIASVRLLDIVKGSDGGFRRMTMDDVRRIARIVRRRIGES